MDFFKESYNYMLYGDSISKGIVFDDEKNKYVTLKESFANILQSKLKGVINNSAKFGNTIIKGISKFQNDYIKKNPDIVLVEFGGNDCDFDWQEIADNPDGEHKPKTDINIFRQSLLSFTQQLEKINVIPVLLTIPPIDADKYLNWVSQNNVILKNKILTWLGTVNKIYWWQERYNSAIVRVAQETGARWIDIREAFLSTPDYTKFICRDGIHPNKEGHQLIAHKIMDYVNSKYSFLLKENSL